MKLNPDCIRDILLDIEKISEPSCYFDFESDSEQLLKIYSQDEIVYHLNQCEYNGFFVHFKTDITGNISVEDLSPKGHAFLANIRENTVWSGVKSVATKVGSTSLDAIVQIASNVISEIIKSQFRLA